MTALLAFDTGTERMIVAVVRDGRVWSHTGAGGAKASATLIGVPPRRVLWRPHHPTGGGRRRR